MSVADILNELPKLTPQERVKILQRLKELETREDLAFLHEAADSMFQEIDSQEA